MNHVGKLAFQWVYWNLLLKGRLPSVPLLPSHMNFIIVGVLTEADFLSSMNLEQSAVTDALESVVRKRRARKDMGTIVDDIMTTPSITIREEDTLRTAVTLMDTNRVKRLIVTDDERGVRGVVSRADLIRLYAMK